MPVSWLSWTDIVSSKVTPAVLAMVKASLVQAAFLAGWALGGAVFGRVGDRLGRSRA